MALSEILKQALPFIPTLVGAITARQTLKPTEAENTQANLLRQQLAYQQAAADPNSPLMKRYQAAENDRLNRNYAKSIQGLLDQHRRQVKLGRTPLFDQERGDEQIWRAGQMGYTENADTARDNARQTILGLATGAGNGATGVGSMVPQQQARQAGKAQYATGLAQTGTDILQRLLKAQEQSQPRATTAWQ